MSERTRLVVLPRRVLRRIRGLSWTRRIEKFHARSRERPAPLGECLDLERRATPALGPDPLKPRDVIRKGRYLRDDELASRLAEEDFGGWSPPIEEIDWLVEVLNRQRPRFVLEFGSGRSTVVFCVILNRLHGASGFRVLSLDQDHENVERATGRLDGLPGRSSCRILHVPLAPAVVAGKPTACYDIDGAPREHFAWLGKAEFVFVDGPYAEGPCRYGTLPMVRTHLAPGARFVMDDALRGKELVAGARWQAEGIVVDGVLALGQGLMVGHVPELPSD